MLIHFFLVRNILGSETLAAASKITYLRRHCTSTSTTWNCPFVEGENTVQRLSFSFPELLSRRTERDGISAIKFEAAQINFLRTFWWLSPSLLLELPQVSSWRRGVKLRHFLDEVWLACYLFFSSQIWYLRKWKFTSKANIWELPVLTPYKFLMSLSQRTNLAIQS